MRSYSLEIESTHACRKSSRSIQSFLQSIDNIAAPQFDWNMMDGAVGTRREFHEAAKVLSWNKLLLSILGIWPKEPSELLFVIMFGYFGIHMLMEYLDLFLHMKNLEHVMMNLTENIGFTQILIRMAMLRRYNKRLGEVINEALNDFDAGKYKSPEEGRAFIKYNARSKLFVKLIVAFVAFTVLAYFVKPHPAKSPQGLSEVVANDNATPMDILSYRVKVFSKIKDLETYSSTYPSPFPIVLIAGFGQSAADCLMVTLVFHVCGQMSVLANCITKMNSDAQFCDDELRNIVKEHTRLLEMGNTIAEAFSETLLGQMVGAALYICILGYQVLTNFANGQNANLATFVSFVFFILLILYAHCMIGESLITESLNVCKAFYNCDWYNIPTNKARVIIICMAGSQKPLCLTAGKFGIFCLATFTEVLKTSMAYLSVLRSVLQTDTL